MKHSILWLYLAAIALAFDAPGHAQASNAPPSSMILSSETLAKGVTGYECRGKIHIVVVDLKEAGIYPRLHGPAAVRNQLSTLNRPLRGTTNPKAVAGINGGYFDTATNKNVAWLKQETDSRINEPDWDLVFDDAKKVRVNTRSILVVNEYAGGSQKASILAPASAYGAYPDTPHLIELINKRKDATAVRFAALQGGGLLDPSDKESSSFNRGEELFRNPDEDYDRRTARSAVGLKGTDWVYLVAVDTSPGMTIRELMDFMNVDLQLNRSMALDGGGSTQMAVRRIRGNNVQYDQVIPGAPSRSARSVPTSLLVYGRPLAARVTCDVAKKYRYDPPKGTSRHRDREAWQFQLRFIEHEGIPVKLKRTQLVRMPAGIQDPKLTMKDVPVELSTAPGSQTKVLGPEYLMVSRRDNNYQGRYLAMYEGKDINDNPVACPVRIFFTGRPPEKPEIKILKPTQKDLARTFDPKRCKYELDIKAVVHKELEPEIHRMAVALKSDGERSLWCRPEVGSKSATFFGRVPLPPGPFELTLSLPDVDDLEEKRITGEMGLSRTLEDVSKLNQHAKDIEKHESLLANAEPRLVQHYKQIIARYHQMMAEILNRMAERGPAEDACRQALDWLARHGQKNATTEDCWLETHRQLAEALYHTGRAGELETVETKRIRRYLELAELEESGSAMERFYLDHAARSSIKLVERLLVLGVAPENADSPWQLVMECHHRIGWKIPENRLFNPGN